MLVGVFGLAKEDLSGDKKRLRDATLQGEWAESVGGASGELTQQPQQRPECT